MAYNSTLFAEVADSRVLQVDSRQVTAQGAVLIGGVQYREMYLSTPGTGMDDVVVLADQPVSVANNSRCNVVDVNGASHVFTMTGNTRP